MYGLVRDSNYNVLKFNWLTFNMITALPNTHGAKTFALCIQIRLYSEQLGSTVTQSQ